MQGKILKPRETSSVGYFSHVLGHLVLFLNLNLDKEVQERFSMKNHDNIFYRHRLAVFSQPLFNSAFACHGLMFWGTKRHKTVQALCFFSKYTIYRFKVSSLMNQPACTILHYLIVGFRALDTTIDNHWIIESTLHLII